MIATIEVVPTEINQVDALKLILEGESVEANAQISLAAKEL